MKAYKIPSRYNHSHLLENHGKFAYFKPDVNSLYLRAGGLVDFLEFIDPDGGPYICVGMCMKTLHKSLPNKSIKRIKYLKSKRKYKFDYEANKPEKEIIAPRC